MQYHKQHNEIAYQAELYSALKRELADWGEYDVQLEYRHEDCIFDLIVAKADKIILIVETKKLKDGSLPNYNTEQIKKYSRFSVPVVICGYNKKISAVIKAIVGFCILSQPDERFHLPDLWNKHLAQLKFMAVTRPKKLKSTPFRKKQKKLKALWKK